MSRTQKLGIAAVVVAGLLAFAWFRWYVPTRHAINVGSAMLAKQVCSCLYIAERQLEACRQDEMAQMDRIPLEVDAEAQRVIASVPGFATRSARFEAGLGCTLE